MLDVALVNPTCLEEVYDSQNGTLPFINSVLLYTYTMASIQVFDEIDDDQFDFHGYNLRKFTINIYFKYVLGYIPKERHTNSSFRLLSWENQLWLHPGYVKAAIEASKICIHCVV